MSKLVKESLNENIHDTAVRHSQERAAKKEKRWGGWDNSDSGKNMWLEKLQKDLKQNKYSLKKAGIYNGLIVKHIESLLKILAEDYDMNESLNEGFATEEGRKLDKMASLLGYDDFHEMVGDNPGVYEVIAQWVDEYHGDNLVSEMVESDVLEELGLYQAAEDAKQRETDYGADEEAEEEYEEYRKRNS